MPGERFADPEVTQALEEAEDALRAERRALGPLPGENAELQARLERLKAERDQLRGELEGLRKGRARSHPRLPDVLEPPFKVRPHVSVRRQLRKALPFLALAGVLLIFMRGQLSSGLRIFLLVLGVVLSARFLASRRGRPGWHFRETGIEESGQGRGRAQAVPYSAITGVKVHATASQHRRGVGTIEMTWRAEPGEGWEKTLTLEDVPEPERLAAWIESKRSDMS
jgi:hypothetical protein